MKMNIGRIFLALVGVCSANAWWQPKLGTTWQIQEDGDLDTSFNVQMYMFTMEQVTPDVSSALHAQGKYVICYTDIGALETYAFDYANYSKTIIGNVVAGFPDENWVDMRDPTNPLVTTPTLWRLDYAVSIGCDGIMADVMWSVGANTGFSTNITAAQQTAFDLWLATEAHKRNLTIGENLSGGPLVPAVVSATDYCLQESCFREDEDGSGPTLCQQISNAYTPLNKAVFQIEYDSFNNISYQLVNGRYNFPVGSYYSGDYCNAAKAYKFSPVMKHIGLDAWSSFC